MEEKSTYETLEVERKDILKKTRIMYAIAAALVAVAVVLLLLLMNNDMVVFIVCIPVIAAIILFAMASKNRKTFGTKFKNLVVTSLVKEELGEEAVYNPNGRFDINEINSLKAAAVPDRYHMEDFISCKYNDVPYAMCDCVLEEKHVTTDSRGHRTTTYVPYFKGRVIKIDYKRELNIELKIANDAPKGFSPEKLQKFETEVIDFNKRFKCYVDDTEHGFYILTPVMINKMMQLESMYRGGICYIFKHNCLYVLINNSSDSLEINIGKPLDENQLSRIRADIVIASTIINEFSMDKDKYNNINL